MKIGFDFDRVLFDTDAFDEYMKTEIEGLHHVDEDVFDDNGNYSPEKHARACGLDPEDLYESLENLEKFLFDDVSLLNQLRQDFEVVIVTRGEEKFQKAKVEGSGADKFVDNVIVVENGSKDVGIDFLVDDRKKELEEVSVPGFQLDRNKDSLEDAIAKVEQL